MDIKRKQILIKNLLCFEEIAKHNSVSRAAENNGMKQSNVSSSLKELENMLDVRLFNRVHNGMQLNEIGKSVFEITCGLDNVINQIQNFNTEAYQVAGDIKLWTSDGLGAGFISSCLPDFYLRYPDVHIEIVCSLNIPNSTNGVDMAVVYEKPKGVDIELVAEHCLRFGFFASMDYLSKFGYPKNLKDLQENYKVCTRDNYAGVWPKWNEFIGGAKHIVASTNSSSMLLRLTKDGIGIALHPLGTAQKDTDLIHLSKLDFELEHRFWIVARKETKDMPKVKALIDFIKDATLKL